MVSGGKTPPSPSLNSNAGGSVVSFSMQPQEHRLMPLGQDRIKASLEDCENIKFAAYRMAVKVEVLQAALRLDKIRFGVVCNIFHHHGLTSSENEVVLDSSEASDIVSDIFFAASKVRSYYSPPMDVEALTDAAVKCALDIFDPKGTGGVLVAYLKMFFVVLCEGRLRDKFLYMFRQFEDGSGHLTRRGLTGLLRSLAQLAEHFGEAISFGQPLVTISVEQCFTQNATAHLGESLSEDIFSKWLMQEPQIVVWLPTHFRLVMSRGVRHGLRCSNCRMEDIIGMRYQCLRCLNFDLCQNCFFRGKKTRGHKLEHPMQEYCYRSTKKDATKAFMKLLVNKMRRRKLSQMRQRYLSPQPQQDADKNHKANSRSSTAKGRRKQRNRQHNGSTSGDDSSGFHSEAGSGANSPEQDAVDNGAAVKQLASIPGTTVVRQEGDRIVLSTSGVVEEGGENDKALHENTFNSIVMHLEEANKEIMGKVNHAPLTDDCVQMQVQLNRLKSLMDQIFSNGAPGVVSSGSSSAPSSQSGSLRRRPLSLALSEPSLIESTPVVMKSGTCSEALGGGRGKRRSLIPAGTSRFSPICKKPPQTLQQTPISAIYPNHYQKQHQQQIQSFEITHPPPGASYLPDLPEDSVVRACRSSILPEMSELSLGDLTSLLVKTGQVQPEENELERLNITEGLELTAADTTIAAANDEDTMEELETLMLKLDTVFKSFGDKDLLGEDNASVRSRSQLQPAVGGIVSEVGDQIHAFNYQFREDHEM